MKLKLEQPEVVARLIEAYEIAKNLQDSRAMADIAITINEIQKEKE